MRDRTAYIPGTMTLAPVWTPAPAAGSSLEAWRAWYDLNCPGGEFNEAMAQYDYERTTEHSPENRP